MPPAPLQQVLAFRREHRLTPQHLLPVHHHCSLLDQAGRVVWQKEAVFDVAGEISVNNLSIAPGTYVVEVQSNNEVLSKTKLVIY